MVFLVPFAMLFFKIFINVYAFKYVKANSEETSEEVKLKLRCRCDCSQCLNAGVLKRKQKLIQS